MFQKGQQIGGYILISRLGKGGFGEVWLAEKRSQFVTKKVAVKLPLDEQVNFEAIKHEATLWEQASGHPNVLPIIDADVYDGQVVIVSEYADGGSLYDRLKAEGKLPVKLAVEMTVGILNGLEFLHHKRIIHRDIKPQNILLQGNTPRLADFGISRAMQTAAVSSSIIGTDAYMSPEAFEGKRSVQTDIWAVGVVLYQLLTGILPFPQEHPTERMFAILMKDFEFPTNDTPRELQTIIRTALAKNPDERFQSASAMQEDLRDFLHSASPPAKTALAPPPTIESVKPVIEQSYSLPQMSEQNVVPDTIQIAPQTFAQASQAQTIAFKAADPPPAQNNITSSLLKPVAIITLALVLLAGISIAGYFVYQKVSQRSQANSNENDFFGANKTKDNLFSGLSKEEMELLLEDANPLMLKQMKEDPKIKKQQIESLRQVFTLANQAIKDGLANDVKTKKELENIRIELIAGNYDKEVNKDKGSMPPFSLIGEDRIKKFWEEAKREAEFKEYLDLKAALARESGQMEKDRALTEEDIKQAKDYFAKTRISYTEAQEKGKTLSEKFLRKNEVSVKLQQAQFLARRYSTEFLAGKIVVTDEDVQKYIAEHPELNTKGAKKAKANEVLQRLKNGEDFAKLAKEFSEDPGSKDKGGLYEDVTEGSMDKTFESAALALQPGQMTADLVETSFGYHIIKLVSKGQAKDPSGQIKQTYSLRHILFSTMLKDPENPLGWDLPVKDYVKQKLEAEKEKQVLDKLVADNPVTIAEDFPIRDVTDEEIRKYQQQMPQTTTPQSNSNVKK